MPTYLPISPSMSVRLVATNCGIDIDLGVKGKSGILHSMESRAGFLTDTSQRASRMLSRKPTRCANANEFVWFILQSIVLGDVAD